jgi:hypothetical protein
MDPEFAGGELEIRNFDREDSGRRSERWWDQGQSHRSQTIFGMHLLIDFHKKTYIIIPIVGINLILYTSNKSNCSKAFVSTEVQHCYLLLPQCHRINYTVILNSIGPALVSDCWNCKPMGRLILMLTIESNAMHPVGQPHELENTRGQFCPEMH